MKKKEKGQDQDQKNIVFIQIRILEVLAIDLTQAEFDNIRRIIEGHNEKLLQTNNTTSFLEYYGDSMIPGKIKVDYFSNTNQRYNSFLQGTDTRRKEGTYWGKLRVAYWNGIR